MLSSFPFLFVMAAVVEGRNDETIHGWVAEPESRGTWSLLWSCLATIFICTWSALHLNIPKRHENWYLYRQKVGWMLMAAIAPELILYNASTTYFEARLLLKELKGLIGPEGHKWTLTHARFACAEGFCTRTRMQRKEAPCPPEVLGGLIESGDITGPPISEKELRSRGETNDISRLIAVLQIAWFGLQILFRAIQHYQITALEIMTTAFVFCSFFIYGFYWNQPQNVEYPVFLDIEDKEVPELISAKDNTGGEPGPVTRTNTATRLTKGVRGLVEDAVPMTLLLLFACGFGAMHCLAWNAPFPTFMEKLAWRVCSVSTTSLPAVAFLWAFLFKDKQDFVSIFPLALLFVCYVIGRITTVVLAFMALRALPPDAYRMVNWSNYLPHFTA